MVVVDVSSRNDLTRRDGRVFCRRCGSFQPEEQGTWRKVRMLNGVQVVQFICGRCGADRRQALKRIGRDFDNEERSR